MKVSVFSDVVSAWCYVAVTRLERAAASFTLESGEAVDVAFRSYQLDPSTPSAGTHLVDALADELGDRERALESLDPVVRVGRADGIEFDFDNAVQANSFEAQRLLLWAGATAGMGDQRDLAHELWKAHFSEGADIADRDTLIARSALVGLDADAAEAWLASDGGGDEVRLQRETAQSVGITSAPTVVVDGRYVVAGAQTQGEYVRLFAQVAAERGTR